MLRGFVILSTGFGLRISDPVSDRRHSSLAAAFGRSSVGLTVWGTERVCGHLLG